VCFRKRYYIKLNITKETDVLPASLDLLSSEFANYTRANLMYDFHTWNM